MGTIAFPNIAEQPQYQPADTLGEFQRAAQLQGQTQANQQSAAMAPLQQKQAQQQIAGGDIELQQKQQQLADQKAMTASMHDWDGKDPSLLPGLVIKHGGSAQAVMGLQQQITARQVQLSQLSKDQLSNKKDQNDQLSGQLSAALSGDDDGLHDRLLGVANTAATNGWADPQHIQSLQSMASLPPDQLRKNASIYQKSLTGEAAQISQAKDTAEAAQNQAKAEAEQKQVIPELGLVVNKVTGATTPISGAPGGIMPPQMMEGKYVTLQQKKAAGQPLAPEDQAFIKGYEKYKTLVPAATIQLQGGLLSDQAKQMAAQMYQQTGQMPAGMRSPGMSAGVLNAAAGQPGTAIPDVAANKRTYAAQTAEQKAFTSGSQGQQLTAIGTARNHMQTFKDTADALDNGNFLKANQIGNYLGMQFGSDKATNFNIARSAFAGEVGKAFAGANVGVEDRRDLIDKISAASSPAQLKGYADTADALLAGKQKSLKESYQQGMQGKPNFGTSGQTATGPNGHKIVVRNGQWVDAQTGAPVQ